MKFFNFVSTVLHPLVMPFYFFLLFFFSAGIMLFPFSSVFNLLLFVVFTLIVLPGLSIFFSRKLLVIGNGNYSSKRDRTIVLAIMTFFYFFNFKIWHDKAGDVFYDYIFGNFALIAGLLLIFNFFYALDWYTIAWGSLLGFYLVLVNTGYGFQLGILSAIILLAGLLGVARINQESVPGKSGNIYLSFFMGFAATFILGAGLIFF